MQPGRRPGPDEPDEQEARWAGWMAAAQQGDRAAYEALLRELAPYLRRAIAGRLRVREDVEDVVQDTLLTIHRIRDTWQPGRPFKAWLSAIARRRTIDRLRRYYRSAAAEVALEPEHETISHPEANEYEERLPSKELRDAVASLPARQREAFMMLKVRELSLKEAAGESGLSEGSLKVAVHRAVRTLRLVLGRVRDGS